MAKKTDDKNKKDDDKDLDKEELDNESEEDEDEEDEESSDEDEDEDEDDEDDEEEEAVAPAKATDRKRPRHEEYLDGEEGHREPEEDSTWWAPHAVLGVLVLLGVLGFLGVFNKALGFLAAKPGGGSTETATATQTSAQPAQNARPMPPQAPQAPREMFGAKHLLVMYKGSMRAPATVTRTQEEAKARATEAMKKAKADPSKFADLVKEYSDEPGAGDRGGDLGKFPKGAMVPEFQAGLEKIKVGEVSDVVETKFGYHVILRTQ